MNPQAPTQPNPFPGLRPFRSDEHHLFFGREEQTAVLLKLLRSFRFLAIVGTSGSGKSSLVRAGMIPELYGGTMTQAGSSWEVVVLRPGGSPIENLARALIESDFYDAENPETLLRLRATLSRSRFGLVEAVKQSELLTPGTNLLVVVDQFEELFRFRQQGIGSEETAAAFVNLLLTASTQAECPIYVAITMRSDYLGDCSEIPGLAEAVNEGEYLIPRLSRDQKREAIEKPIGVGGARISPLLAQRLLNDVGDDPDQLPVLQHALMRMWDVWSAAGDLSRPIDLSDLEATGGLDAALSNHADEIFGALPDDLHRAACDKIFKTLTEKGTDNRGIRRPTRLAELEAIAGVDRATATTVLDAFRRHGVTFLMPGPDRELSERTVLDLSHESLMRGWQRLRGWVEEEAQSARIFQRLRDTASLWRDGKAGLFRDPDLQIAISWRDQQRPSAAWARQYGGDFEQAQQFLDESAREAAAAEQALEAARQRELVQARAIAEAQTQRAAEQTRFARRLKWFVGGLALVAMLAVAALIAALFAREQAKKSELLSQEQKVRADKAGEQSQQLAETLKSTLTRADFVSAADQLDAGQPERSLSLLARSLRTDPSYSPAAFRAMETLSTRGFPVKPPIIFKQEKPIKAWGKTTNSYIWTIDLENRGFLWNIDTAKRISPLAGGKQVDHVQFSDDGRLVFTAVPADGILRGWHAETGAAATPEIKPGPGFGDYVLSPKIGAGQFLMVKTAAGALQIWDVFKGVTTSPPLKTGGKVTSFNISPDGRFAFGDFDDRTLGVWSVPDGKALLSPVRHGLVTSEIRFSPDSHFLVLRSESSRQVTWWNLENRGSPSQSAELGAPAREIFFDSRSHKVLIAGWDQRLENRILRLQTIDLASGERSPAIEEPRMTRDLWPEIDQRKRTIDSWIAGGIFDSRQVKIWDLYTGKVLTELPSQESPISIAMLSPDGSRIALSPESRKSVRLWDVFSGKPVSPAIDFKGILQSLSFSADGEKLFTFHTDGSTLLTVWDARTGEALTQPLAVSGGNGQGTHMGRDRSRLVILATQWVFGSGIAPEQAVGEVAIVDIEPGIAERIPLKMGGAASQVKFSRDGARLLGTEFNGNPSYAFVWNTTNRRLLYRLKHPASIRDGDFAPDGSHLLTAASDGLVRIWNIDTGELVSKLSLEGDVWMAKYSPNGELIATLTIDARVQVWDAASGVALFPPRKHGPFVESLDFSPDGRQLLTGASDSRARLINAQTGEAIFPPIEHRGGRGVFATLSPDGKVIFTVTFGGPAIAWSAETGERIKEMAVHSEFHLASFNPQGNVVATGSGLNDDQDGFVHLWDWRKGTLLAEPMPIFGRAALVRFSHAGNLVAAQSIPGRLKVWDSQTGRLLLERNKLQKHSNSLTLDFSPNGSQLAAGFGDGSVEWIDLPQLNRRVPEWFPELAETIAGKRLNAQGSTEMVGLDRLGAVQAKIPNAPDDYFGTWAHWFLSDRKARPISTGSGWTIPQLALQLSQDSNIKNQFKALQFDPSNGVLYARLSFALTGSTLMTNAVAHATNHWNSVVQWYSNQATNLAPDSAEVWALRAGTLIAIGKPELSAAAVDRAITLDAKNPNAWYVKALTLGAQNKPDASYQAFVKALELLPEKGGEIEWHNQQIKPFLLGALREFLALEKSNPLTMAQLGRRRLGDSSDRSDRRFWEAKWLTRRAVELAPNDAEVWRLRSEALFEPADEAEALAAWKKAFDLDAEGNLAWQDYGRFLNARTTILEQLNRHDEARKYYLPRAIPPRSKDAKPVQIDLGDHFTSSLLESPHRTKDEAVGSNYWDKLPIGLQTLAGIEFDMRGIVHLDSASLGDGNVVKYPRESRGIQVKSKAGWLHFLHTTGWGNQKNGMIIGQYRLRYSDGQSRDLPIVIGRDVRDWFDNPFVETTHSQIAWAGYCVGSHKTLFMSSWENPRPEVEIAAIDFISDMTPAGPMLMAITLEQPWSQEHMAALPTETLRDMAQRTITRPQGLNDWGRAYAKTLIDAALLKAPNDPDNRRVHAEVLLAVGNKDEAGSIIDALLAVNTGDHAAWNLKARLLADSGSSREALASWEKAVGLLAGPETFDGDKRQGYIRQAVEQLKSAGQIAEARSFFLRANIPNRDARAFPGAIDLTPYYNGALNECWFERGDTQPFGAVLKSFPRGTSTLLDVPFDVRGVIQLNDRTRSFVRTFPNEVPGIQVGLRGDQIHFLHAASISETVGTPIALYRIHYQNGETRELPVVYGRDVRDFYERDEKDDALMAWRGRKITAQRGDIAIFLSSWDNPLPGMEIASIDFVSTLSRAQPFLLGITVESFRTGNDLERQPAKQSAQLALHKVNPKLRPAEATIAYSKRLSDRAIAQAPNDPKVWQLRGTMLFELGELDSALAAAEKSLLLNADSSQSWALKADILEKLGKPATAKLARTDVRPREIKEKIPARPAGASSNLIDLTAHYTVSLTEEIHATIGQPENASSSLSALPSGIQPFGGVSFDVRGVIKLWGERLEMSNHRYTFPRSVSGIKIRKQCKTLHFLQGSGTSLDVPAGTLAGSYLVHYADGGTQEIPLRIGIDFQEWSMDLNRKNSVTGATLAWRGPGPTSSKPDEELGIYLKSWPNPRPAVEITHLDFVSAMKEPSPFLIAITVE